MKTKPLSIKLIALGFFIAPFINLFQIAYFNHWPLTGPRSVFYHLNSFEWAILGFFFVAGFGVLSVKKWGYFTCLVFLSFLILNNIYALIFNEKAYGPYVIVLFELITFGVVGFFLQHHVIAPYFNPKMRWWESRERIKVNLQGQIRLGPLVTHCEVVDISSGGCFIYCERELVINDMLWVNISLGNNHITTMAEVVWVKKPAKRALPVADAAISPPELGFGLIFRSIQKSERKILQRILSELKLAAKNSGGQKQAKRDTIKSA